jgi:hypothetical protein
MDGFLSALKDRVSNPLISSIIISWVLINYEFLFVVFSSDTAMSKIQLVNNQLYYDSSVKLLRWILLPVLLGCMYTFLYPYIDIKVSAFLERMKVRRAKDLLEISRLTPVSAEVQTQYFEEQDKEITHYKDRLQAVILGRDKDIGRLRETNRMLYARSARQTLRFFCLDTAINPEIIPAMLEQDRGTFSESCNDPDLLYMQIFTRAEFPALLRLAQESMHRETSVDELRLIDAQSIRDVLDKNEAAREDFLELVIALGLVSRFYDSFNINTENMAGIIRIAREVSIINERRQFDNIPKPHA